MTPAEENALRIENIRLNKENEIIKKLSTKQGFFGQYYCNLRTCKNNIEAYEQVNNEYFKYFKEFRFHSYEAFRKQKNRFFKK